MRSGKQPGTKRHTPVIFPVEARVGANTPQCQWVKLLTSLIWEDKVTTLLILNNYVHNIMEDLIIILEAQVLFY